jgi:glucokinase
MYLGIEIGGTKLQLGIGSGDGSPPILVERRPIRRTGGASAILEAVAEVGPDLVHRYEVTRIGVGFGGPLEPDEGRIYESHQVAGWDGFPLGPWCEANLGRPTVVGNDCAIAGLAEARFGAGRGHTHVFFVNVGTGVGGGFAIGGELYRGGGPAVAEIGQMRLSPDSADPTATVESLASGLGIVASALGGLEAATGDGRAQRDVDDLMARCDGQPDRLTGRNVADAAADGNAIAANALEGAQLALGWAIGQVVTLVGPDVVVVGGGVSLIGEERFLGPVRAAVERLVFPLMRDSYEVRAAELGELVVVHGALAIAAQGRVFAGDAGFQSSVETVR